MICVLQSTLSSKVIQQDYFKLIKLTIMESRVSNHSSQAAINIPKREEWALIYQHRALELQRARSMEKMLLQQKRDNFKKLLDNQLEQKHSKGAAQKEEDRRYYEYVVRKAQEMKQKQDKQKLQRYINIKQLQQHNKQIIQTHNDPKQADNTKFYNIQIGVKSELQKKQRAQAIKKDVIQTLDKQRLQKSMEKEAEREKEMLMKQKNEDYQARQFENRNRQTKRYEQNINVYNQYKNLYQEKMKKDKELQRKFVDEVQQRKLQDENKKKEQEITEKQRRNLQMMDTLSRQIQLINHRKQQDKLNPEQVTYSFINSIFRQKKPSFDKQEYSLYLQKQAQEQRLNKIQQKYMSQEEYRLNSNQLNKAINGNYTFDNYQDRSMVTLGDRINMNKVQPLEVPDAAIVKTKLNDARNNRRGRSLNNTSLDLSSPFF